MRSRTAQLVVLAALEAACSVGPVPRDASNPGTVPIHNTAAVIENEHAVTEVDPSGEALAVLAEPDRDPRDRALDARYQGGELLTFLDVHPGMRVADLTAGGGYATELLARGAGPSGEVFANEPPSLVRGTAIAKALVDRVARTGDVHIVPLGRELASPLPALARDLDLVYLSLPYRTAEALGVDTAAMNRSAFDALAPGGRYVVVDFRALVRGPTPRDLHEAHREESTNVRRQVEAAGFELLTEGRFLRNDPSPTEWDAILTAHPTALEEQDRFLLEFVKP